ncbi:uncharacterized protein RCC_08006 [Ramularia collo-cygni]|uniref:SH3 domain-containing protein n=1 Tax=Ramularia collo-cygni TaxID=112498 RepID=A0A2D3VBF4_9PEZI|nr:uncharacterized protein RCC_08006 [Ramularia collo-cygni]CZT22137.1 uncharacterized protein RCC_08006 [Ramularia collo-cygni]
MATAMSAPPLDDSLNFTTNLDNPHQHNLHNTSKMAADDDDQYTVERPRAVASSIDRNGSSSSSTSDTTLPPPPLTKKVSRLGLAKNKGKLAVTTPSQEDLHSRWAEFQDPSSVINSNSFKSEQHKHLSPLSADTNNSTIDNGQGEASMAPAYVEPAPRPLFYTTIIRDFAFPTHHYLHNGSPSHMPEEDELPPGYGLSATAPSFTPGRNGDAPGPYRHSNSHRRLSDSAETSTYNSGLGDGGHWVPGIWGGDGAMYEDMQPLPSTSFREEDVGWNNTTTPQTIKKQHRKSRSFADTFSYERGRRRGESNASKRGSYHQGNENGGHSDPAGREALRASRGMEPSETGDLEDDMYSLSLSQQTRPRRDSHVAATQTLPSRAFHEAQLPHLQSRMVDSDLPLDLEDFQHSSPQRESLGPEDEELYNGPSLALYDFEPENDNELRIREREIIMVSYRHGLGWLVAENENGEKGLVPEEYVRLLSEMEEWEGVVVEE